MGLFSKKTSSDRVLGVYLGDSGGAIAEVSRERPYHPVVRNVARFDPDESGEAARALEQAARGTGLTAGQANVVLSHAQYQLLLVETPRVDPDELRAAIRWKIKDLIDFHIDDAVIDVFEIPGQHNRPEGQSMMYAVAARQRRIAEVVDLAERLPAELHAIDITELAMRNLAALDESDTRGAAMLYFGTGYGILTITRQGELYMTRRLNLGHESLDGSETGAFDQVLLEVQRSMDYYTSRYSQPQPVSALLLPGFVGDSALIRWMSENLDIEAQAYDVSRALDMQCSLDPDCSAKQLLAIGGALRREEVTL
jgi:MSHA biogenesis protein MshI